MQFACKQNDNISRTSKNQTVYIFYCKQYPFFQNRLLQLPAYYVVWPGWNNFRNLLVSFRRIKVIRLSFPSKSIC